MTRKARERGACCAARPAGGGPEEEAAAAAAAAARECTAAPPQTALDEPPGAGGEGVWRPGPRILASQRWEGHPTSGRGWTARTPEPARPKKWGEAEGGNRRLLRSGVDRGAWSAAAPDNAGICAGAAAAGWIAKRPLTQRSPSRPGRWIRGRPRSQCRTLRLHGSRTTTLRPRRKIPTTGGSTHRPRPRRSQRYCHPTEGVRAAACAAVGSRNRSPRPCLLRALRRRCGVHLLLLALRRPVPWGENWSAAAADGAAAGGSPRHHRRKSHGTKRSATLREPYQGWMHSSDRQSCHNLQCRHPLRGCHSVSIPGHFQAHIRDWDLGRSHHHILVHQGHHQAARCHCYHTPRCLPLRDAGDSNAADVGTGSDSGGDADADVAPERR